MISVKEARALVDKHAKRLQPEILPLPECVGKVLAEDVFATIDLPPFDQSAMDGFAFHYTDAAGNRALKVSGEIPAGNQRSQRNQSGEAIKIFTGAPLPEGADTVVILEKVTASGEKIFLNDPLLKSGGNVRLQGSEIRKGEKALETGTILSPAAIGFLAGLGLTEARVFPSPVISLLVTGKELSTPGEILSPGKIYESNSFALKAAMQMIHLNPAQVLFNDDNREKLKADLNSLIESSDLVIVSGGISVGDYDFVKELLVELSVDTIFYKVKQRPGKPLYFGKKNETLVFALPGNPSSALTCYYMYVVLANRKMMGFRNDRIERQEKKLSADFTKKDGLTFFLKGKIDGESVTVLPAQESGKMHSFALADCLIEMEEGRSTYQAGDLVAVHPVKME